MTHMTRIRSLAALLCVAALGACGTNAVQDITRPVAGLAFVRFHNLSVGSPSVNFYANDQKLTAISATTCSPPPATPNPLCTTTGIEATIGTAYGSSALGGNYASVAPGTYTLTGRITAAADNGLTVASVSAPLAAEKFYSYFMSGIYNSTGKTTDVFVVTDDLPTTFDYTKAYVRIVNASSNAPSISATFQLQGTSALVTVASNVAYKSASPIITIAPGLTDMVFTLSTGATARATGINFTGGHVFTIALRGDATSTTTTGLALTTFVNR